MSEVEPGTPFPDPEAAALVARIRAGDTAAESKLVERYSRGLSYLLRKLTGHRETSEDLHQETFRIALARIRAGELREPEKLNGFLRQTAKNLATNFYRKRNHREVAEPEDAAEPTDPAPGPLARLLRGEEATRVRRVLAELRSSRDRELLWRFYIAEEDREPLCAELGLSRLQFNLILFRARERFRKLVEEAEGRPKEAARWPHGS